MNSKFNGKIKLKKEMTVIIVRKLKSIMSEEIYQVKEINCFKNKIVLTTRTKVESRYKFNEFYVVDNKGNQYSSRKELQKISFDFVEY